MTNILYISLTGMTEPLGRSQVLEYLVDLSENNRIYLLSFERKNDIKNLEAIKQLTAQHTIKWHYFLYSNKYGIFSTISQIIKAIYFSSRWIKKNNIKIIHARSMIPATMGYLLKKIYGIKLLFDIRGFAIDEKVDSGRLKKNTLFFQVLKKLDNFLYCNSDHIVTLTHKAKKLLNKNLAISSERIIVIPTCASRDIFKIMNQADKETFKISLGYSLNDKIILHTGTVSGWYDFEKEVLLVKEIMQRDDHIRFIVLNKLEQNFIKEIIEKYKLPTNKIYITSASFDNMYQYLNLADVSLFFIKPSYSKQASAPTKFAENVACLLPSVTNGDVGDMGYYLQHYDVGYVVNLHTLNDNLEKEAKNILEKLLRKEFGQSDFISLFNEHFDKKIAISKYQQIYEKLEKSS